MDDEKIETICRQDLDCTFYDYRLSDVRDYTQADAANPSYRGNGANVPAVNPEDQKS